MAATTPTLRDTLSHPVWYPYSIDEVSPSFKASLLRDWMGTPAKAVKMGVLEKNETKGDELKEFLSRPELPKYGYGRNSLFTAIIGGASTNIVKQIGNHVDPFATTDAIIFPGSGHEEERTLLPIHAAWHVNNLSLFKHLLTKMAKKRGVTNDEMLVQVLDPPEEETWLPLRIFAGIQPTSKFKNYFKDTGDRLVQAGVTPPSEDSSPSASSGGSPGSPAGSSGSPAGSPAAGSSSGTSAPTEESRMAHQQTLLQMTHRFLAAAKEAEEDLKNELEKKNAELSTMSKKDRRREKIVGEARALVEKEKQRVKDEYEADRRRQKKLEKQVELMRRQREAKDADHKKEMARLEAEAAKFGAPKASSSTSLQAQIASFVRFQHFRE